jgi:hypothetical protein
MNLVSAIRLVLRAQRGARPCSRARPQSDVGPSPWPGASGEYPQLYGAVFCRLLEVGDAVEQGDVEAARRAMAIAAAIEGELWCGNTAQTSVPDLSDEGSGDDR